MVFEPLELVGNLTVLVPPPMFNLVRYHGILAPAARWRPFVDPSDREAAQSVHHSGSGAGKQLDHPESYQKWYIGRRWRYRSLEQGWEGGVMRQLTSRGEFMGRLPARP
jgi:hypothetical protein